MIFITLNFFGNVIRWEDVHTVKLSNLHRVFSCDITAAMLVSLNKETVAMLVSPSNPPGIGLLYHANVFFYFGGKTRLLITRVKTLYCRL